MPELPEVETIVRDLRPRLVGRRVTAVRASRKPLRKRWQRRWADLLAGRSIAAVDRRGKWIRIDLDADLYLVIHLGMTGQLRVVPIDQVVEPHTHLVFDLDAQRRSQRSTNNGSQLRFRDVRRFGSATVFESHARLEAFFDGSKLGPEPFALSSGYWCEQLAGTRRCLKAVLLDQQVVAGVGNIYADEALFEAHLHPSRLACELKQQEIGRLARAVVTVLNRAIDKRGSSIRDYLDGSGEPGGYQREFRVYGQTGEPCSRCRRPIERIRLAGRSTHFCPRCQRDSSNGRKP